jgi:hypothetical protein
MNTKGMTKYLIMVILMTSINIPLFIYSRSFLKSEHAGMETIDMHGPPAQTPEQGLSDAANTNPEDKPSNQVAPAADSLAIGEKPAARAEPAPFANLYRPPLLGKCKKLFERFMRENDPDKPFRAFVYSFDGETAYCAGAVTDKSKKKAEEIARKDCEENQAGTGKYSPCRIYTSEETN